MMLASLLFPLLCVGDTKPSSTPNLLAIRVGKAETIAKGTIEHAVILVENGKIVTIGEDLPIEHGIPILDRPDWVVMPGLVDAYSRLGLDSEGGDDMAADVKASAELYPQAEEFQEIVKYGVTTLGLYPAGNGIPGQACAIRPLGKTKEEMLLADGCYLKMISRATPSAKKLFQDGFKKADDYAEKEKKAREKFDKDKKGKKDDKKEEKKEEPKSAANAPKSAELRDEANAAQGSAAADDAKTDEKKDDGFVPPEPEPKAKPWVDLRSGKLRGLVSINSAAEYVHFLDAIGKETFSWDLRLVVQRESDVFYVLDKKCYDLDYDGIGDKKCRVVMEPVLSVTPGTMRNRNLAMELSKCGAKIVFVPRNDTLMDVKNWLSNVGEMVSASLDRAVALRAVTLEPAELLGVEKHVGSLEKGKDANLLFFDGDPLEPTTKLQAVMLDGRIVHGEVKL
ncbi:MAG: amidohydrolase family protein [Planctomycetota bacterium]